jgi:hypothetical protein
MNKSDEKKLDKTISTFYSSISKLLKAVEAKSKNKASIMRVRKLIGHARDLSPFKVIDEAKDPIIFMSDDIVNRNEHKFLTMSYDQHLNRDSLTENGVDENYIHSLIKNIRLTFTESSDSEKKYLWTLVQTLLKTCIEYTLLKKEYK